MCRGRGYCDVDLVRSLRTSVTGGGWLKLDLGSDAEVMT
jgi:hypothetical protein